MRECLVSVVVPIYNAEKYLEECLDSILSQTYSHIEIILIDDGSTDRSGLICDAYAAQDQRVCVHHKENEGLVRARKTAIQLAKGEYLCFVDADDRIKQNMIEYFVANIGNTDLITSGCEYQLSDGSIKKKYDKFAPNIYSTKEQLDYIFSNMLAFENEAQDGVLPYVWNKMYRTSLLIETVSCVDDDIIKWEDRVLLYPYILRCRSIVITRECFYFYRYVEDSMIHSKSKNVLFNLNRVYLSLESEFLRYPQKDILLYQLQHFVSAKVNMMTEFMGFPVETRTIKYIFPFTNLLENKQFVLYGAGAVGMDYYRQISNGAEGEKVLWVDKQWEKYTDSRFNVKPVEELQSTEFDCVLIAVKRKELADSIKLELLEKGIAEDRIWWKPPINIEGI